MTYNVTPVRRIAWDYGGYLMGVTVIDTMYYPLVIFRSARSSLLITMQHTTCEK